MWKSKHNWMSVMKHNWGNTTMDGQNMGFWVVLRLKRCVTTPFDGLLSRGLLKGLILNKRSSVDTFKWGNAILQIVAGAARHGTEAPAKLSQLKTCLTA
jgi:hypothetical protein